MHAEFRYLTGALAGQHRVIRKDFAIVGRHPSADLPFDVATDLDVSVRHAALLQEGGRWVVRDLGSTNGTFVNGDRITGDRRLAAGDVLRFGSRGPEVRFGPAGDAAGSGSTTERIRREVHRQTAGWKRATLLLLALVLLGGAGMAAFVALERRGDGALRGRLVGRTDSLLAALESARGSVAALEDELDRARLEAGRLRSALLAGRAGTAHLDSLARTVEGTVSSGGVLLSAARFDPHVVDSANADAVGVVVSENAGGERVAGTGFVFRVQGDTGWILTARHLVIDSLGRPASRLGFLFNGSSQNFRSALVATSSVSDLAVLRVRVHGGMPMIRGLGSHPGAGAPVAVFGFPSGLDPAGTWRQEGVRPVTFTGSIRRVTPILIEIDGYGVNGSSGSPVFGTDGRVAGMVFAGDRGSGGSLVYALPSAHLEAFLRELGLTP